MDNHEADNKYKDNNTLAEVERILAQNLTYEDTDAIVQNARRSDLNKINKAKVEALILIYRAKTNAIKAGVEDYYKAKVNEQKIKIQHDLSQANQLYSESLTQLQAQISNRHMKTIGEHINGLLEHYLVSLENIMSKADRVPKSVLDTSIKRLTDVHDKIEAELNNLSKYNFDTDKFLK